MSIKNVIIIGAGGNLGPSILKALDSDKHFNVSVLARHSSKSTFPSHIHVHKIAEDYPEAELLEAFKGQDAVVSAITTSSTAQQHAIIDAAVKAGVKRFLPSEFGSNTKNPKGRSVIPMLFDGKTSAVDYLKSKEKDGLTWSAIVTGPFFDW